MAARRQQRLRQRRRRPWLQRWAKGRPAPLPMCVQAKHASRKGCKATHGITTQATTQGSHKGRNPAQEAKGRKLGVQRSGRTRRKALPGTADGMQRGPSLCGARAARRSCHECVGRSHSLRSASPLRLAMYTTCSTGDATPLVQGVWRDTTLLPVPSGRCDSLCTRSRSLHGFAPSLAALPLTMA